MSSICGGHASNICINLLITKCRKNHYICRIAAANVAPYKEKSGIMAFNFSFFNSPEHRVFNYKPRYYDPEKEALKDKFGHVDGSKSKENYVPGTYLKGSFRNGNYQKTRQTNKAQKIIGLAGLVLFFVVLIYIVKYYALLW